MKRNILIKGLLVGAMFSVSALADMTVDKTGGVLTITSTSNGKVIAKVIGPNDEVIVNETYEGSSFTWSPSGVDGEYRYDVRVEGDYAGGSVEVHNGTITVNNDGEGV